MSYPDYTQRAEDHQCLLVLVRQVGSSINKPTFQRLFDRVCRTQFVRIHRHQRIVWLRYKQEYPVENNDWGDFQAHRKVLGLLCFGQCDSDQSIATLQTKYSAAKTQYSSTLFDSRLILFNKDRSSPESDAEVTTNALSKSTLTRTNAHSDPLTCNEDDKDTDQNSNNPSDPLSTYANAAAVTLNVGDLGKQIENRTRALNGAPPKQCDNGKRAENNNDKKSEDADNKSTGASKQQTVFYPDPDSCRDLEEVLEDFVASLFWILESKRLDRSQERVDRLTLLMTPFERKESVGVDTETKIYRKRCQGRLRKHLGDLCLLAGMPTEALLHYQTSLDILKSANDYLWAAAAYEGICSSSVIMTKNSLIDRSPLNRNRSFSIKRGSSAVQDAMLRTGQDIQASLYANGLDLADTNTKGIHSMLPDDILDKYKEALMFYSKYKNAGIVEMEASLKACRVLIMQKKYLEASDFLQNVVYINLQLSEDEKIERYSTLSQLYTQIGFHRKAAFFKRVAAMQCIAQPNSVLGWQSCYQLLLQSLEGYKLPLDPRQLPQGHANGWAVVQLRVLHELIFSARKMGNPGLAVRHLTFLIHAMLESLGRQEKREICVALESYTAKSEGTTTSITLDNGTILPPVPLSKIPTIKSFKLSNLTPHMQPTKVKKKLSQGQKEDSPFIYTPIGAGLEETKPSGPRVDFKWVEGEVCEVALQVHNPMPFDLKVTNMGLISSGVELEVYPTNFTLPPESGPHPVKIMVVPKAPGILTVSGYTSHVLGIRSNVSLEDLPVVEGNHLEVEVVPSLPQLNLSTSLPQAASFGSLSESAIVVTSASATLYGGQMCECVVTLTNKGKIPIETLEVSIESRHRADVIEQMFSWSSEGILSQLPLQPQSQACFTVYLLGVASFLHPDSQAQGSKYSLASEITGNLSIEAVLKLRYSGGPGRAEQYRRQCAISIGVEVLPSVVFTKWSILPTESDEECHLVFDLENLTSHEMGIGYDENSSTVLEADSCKRLCLSVPKCNVPPSTSHSHANLQSVVKRHLADLVDIRWRMASSRAEGQVRLDHLQWKDSQLKFLLHSPVRWEVFLNGQAYMPNSGVTFQDGCSVAVQIKLHNRSGQLLEDANLSVQCLLDENNGTNTPALGDTIIFSGANLTTVSKLDPDCCLSQDFSLVFLCPGRYSLDIQCTGTLTPLPDVTASTESAISIVYSDSQDSDDANITHRWHCEPKVYLEIYSGDQAI